MIGLVGVEGGTGLAAGRPFRLTASGSAVVATSDGAKEDDLFWSELLHQPLGERLQRLAGNQGWWAVRGNHRNSLGAKCMFGSRRPQSLCSSSEV